MGCDGAGFVSCTEGWTDLPVCPGTFKATIRLIIVSNSSVRTFLLFIKFWFLVCVWSPPARCAIQPFGSQTTGRAGPLLWGKTLPQFEAWFSPTSEVETADCADDTDKQD
jgi:hypothetical protein